MNYSMTALDTTQWTLDCNTNVPPVKDCDSGKDIIIQPGPTEILEWIGPFPEDCLPVIVDVVDAQHQTIQPAMGDPPNLQYHYPCQSPQCPLPYSNYIFGPSSSQYQPPTGPATDATWFTDVGILCSSVPGNLHAPVASVCAPLLTDHQQFKEGQTEFASHLQQHSSEAGSVYHNLKSATTYSDVSDVNPRQEKDWSVLGTHSQFPQPRDQTANMYPQDPTARTIFTLYESKSRKPCHCTRSECLKLYCECFASGLMCSNCDCSNCHNNLEHEIKRHNAIQSCLGRNPDAFRSKRSGLTSGEVKGCNCKRSGCLKNYCECYEANIMCTSSCKCVGCRNFDNSLEMGLKEKTFNIKHNEWLASVITMPVVETVCGCLLAQAEEAEGKSRTPAQAQHMLLDEFGHCLSLIVKAMFKDNTD